MAEEAGDVETKIPTSEEAASRPAEGLEGPGEDGGRRPGEERRREEEEEEEEEEEYKDAREHLDDCEEHHPGPTGKPDPSAESRASGRRADRGLSEGPGRSAASDPSEDRAASEERRPCRPPGPPDDRGQSGPAGQSKEPEPIEGRRQSEESCHPPAGLGQSEQRGPPEEHAESEVPGQSEQPGELADAAEPEDLKTKADDYIDEEKLKELQKNYTEEDKQRLKEEAENFKLKGNEWFRSGEYKESAESYTEGLRTCPLDYNKNRAVLYANRGAAKMKMELNESAIEDCSKAIENDANYVKAVMRRAQLYMQTEKLDEALADYKRVVELDPSNKEAFQATQRLPHEINERNEKLKTEMLGKLKDLGNMILKPFGLSTSNFQMVQDPNTGGYSINFQQDNS